jgi:hypothetical protein
MDEETKTEGVQSVNADRDEKPLDKMTAKELREVAAEIPGVEGVHAMKKDELLKTIKEHRGIQDEKPVRKKKTKKEKKESSRSELKTKIIELKKQKVLAREAKDARQVQILRRRISRMKKMTRKVAQG